jgi:hypothetical protein
MSRIGLVVVVLTLVGVAIALQTFFCPCARLPGGHLLGNEIAAPVSDWSFANAVPLCQVEVQALLPHSVNLNCMASEGRLYLSCADCEGKRWSRTALVDPNVRLRIGDAVYPVTVTRVEDPAELDVAWQARAQKVGQSPATPRAPGWWSFRVQSR